MRAYDRQDLDTHLIWCNDEVAIFVMQYGTGYQVEWYTLYPHLCQPSLRPIEYPDADRLLKLIHNLNLHPTFRHLEMVPDA